MKYEEPKSTSKAEAEHAFATNDLYKLREALVAVALSEEDWRWVQERCLEFTSHEDFTVRAIAATCLGHVARIHRQIDLDRVMPRLTLLQKDPETAIYAEDAISDVEMFVKRAP